LSQVVAQPTEAYYHAAKRVLRYLKGTWDYGLFYVKAGGASETNVGPGVVVYADADYAGDVAKALQGW
jgi:hypothetical protein